MSSPNSLRLALLLLAPLFEDGACLKMLALEVPRWANLSSTQLLECRFDLEGSQLYSVNWYKGGEEFYRYIPADLPNQRVYATQDIRVQMEKSGESYVTLTRLNYGSSGEYTCEVSTEAPYFYTAALRKNMTVYAFPDRAPEITGLDDSYNDTEIINASCSSGYSNPPPKLSWRINGRQVEPSFTRDLGLKEREGGRYSGQIGLEIPVANVSRPEGGGLPSLSCSSAVGDMPPLVATASLGVSSAHPVTARHRASRGFLPNTGTSQFSQVWTVLLLSIVLSS